MKLKHLKNAIDVLWEAREETYRAREIIVEELVQSFTRRHNFEIVDYANFAYSDEDKGKIENYRDHISEMPLGDLFREFEREVRRKYEKDLEQIEKDAFDRARKAYLYYRNE